VFKVGILNDMDHISGDHAWKGALLAAREINKAGGVEINSNNFYIGLVSEDTDEANPLLQVSKGIDAAVKMINDHSPHFIIGGYRTEALLAYQDVIMDANIPLIGTGCMYDFLCQRVLDNYARYKYFFRVMPLNTTTFTNELILYPLSLVDYLNNTYGASTIKIGILYEDLGWTWPIADELETQLPLLNPNISIVSKIAFGAPLTAPEMAAHLKNLDSAGAQIVIPLIPSDLGILMSTQYATIQPGYLLAGFNNLAQLDTNWDDTAGTCQYEITRQAVHNTSKTFLTVPFWNNYIGEYGNEPYYTGTGSYDAVRLLVNATIETQSFNSELIVANLEKKNSSNPFVGVAGNISFTESHDLETGWPYSTSLFSQWQMDGKKVVLPSWGSIYPDFLATGTLSIPYWGINNLVPSYSHKLPGDFMLTIKADDPDTDGAFNISWTGSIGAANYSIYASNEPIAFVSKQHTFFGEQSINSTFLISGLKTGEHYIFVVAYNETGQKFSNSVHISVQLPFPGDFILSSNADDPDTDGIFNLSWTNSVGANNYSVYKSLSSISEINWSHYRLARQTALSPFLINELLSGKYYYVIVAYNEDGETLSNDVVVVVQFDGAEEFISGYDLWLFICAFSLISLISFKRYSKHKK